MKNIAKLILVRLLGWEISGEVPSGIKKAVIIVAPHTSIWDFIYGRLAFWVLETDVKFLINSKFFVGPLGGLLRKLGGFPVKYSKTTSLLLQIKQMYNHNDFFFLVITPEGTRALVERWRKGFYQIATGSDIPIVMAYIDYKNKRGGLGPVFYPTGDYDKDLKEIETFYKNFHARHPERYNLTQR
ncbi:MAG: 1-acyl-sn-glycerol-3-phosphate acyltransferase [Bacteroidales bacterium]|nr:1-acyl-sn-glycerol-3-phosphate acyltransferase [Bacteroidales bacterium]